MRYALALEYDGGPFCGFQSQPSACAIQDAVERALAAIGGRPIRIAAAGRTDAGVHATSQIVHFDCDAQRPQTAWVRGVNSHLPPAIAALWCREVGERFHARFSATARHYTYLLLNRPQRPGLMHGRAGWHHAPLDAGAMREAAQWLLGTHDFSSFRASECQARSPVKTLTRLDVARVGIAQGEALLRFDVSADAFLQHMVRNIVGALVEVGAGRREPAWAGEILAACDRRRGAPTFAAAGLHFTGADYDAGFGLPATRRDVATCAG